MERRRFLVVALQERGCAEVEEGVANLILIPEFFPVAQCILQEPDTIGPFPVIRCLGAEIGAPLRRIERNGATP